VSAVVVTVNSIIFLLPLLLADDTMIMVPGSETLGFVVHRVGDVVRLPARQLAGRLIGLESNGRSAFLVRHCNCSVDVK
jgi:hypothetical protein